MRVYAISDQHGHLNLDIPRCDLLIHAGDICPDRCGPFRADRHPEQQGGWFVDTWMPWRMRQPADVVFATWGNHDYCGHLQNRQHSDFAGRTRLTVDGVVELNGLKIWCSPWSNPFMQWAFMKPPADLAEIYSRIPPDTDIIVSHQPPYGYGDQLTARSHGLTKSDRLGSMELLGTLDRIKPKAVVCGHFHSGRGAYSRGNTAIYNVAVVDEQYQLIHGPTEIRIP
jgi:Icc-related predicted phosphoesterase